MDQPVTQPVADKDTDLDAFLGVQRRPVHMKYVKWGAIALAALLAVWLIWTFFLASAPKPQYATEPLERGDLTVGVTAIGNLAPTQEVEVGSELSGTAVRVNVDVNDRVAKGQILAVLDTTRLQDAINQSRAQVQSAEASVAQAQATVNLNRANLSRLEEVLRLSGGKVPAASEMDTARVELQRAIAGLRTAQASVASARAALSSNEWQFSRALIVSPVTGVVLSRSIDVGQTVAASFNAPVLFRIAEDLSRMRLEVRVDEADVGGVKEGQRATFQVDAFPARTFPARVERVDVASNADQEAASGTTTASSAGQVVNYRAVLAVDNPDLMLRPGMTATAEIVTSEKKNVLLVPNAALRFTPQQTAASGGGVTSVLIPMRGRRSMMGRPERSATIGRGSQQTIYTLDADGEPQPIRVTVGDSDGSQTEVSGADLKPGMRIITGQLAAEGAARRGGGGNGGARRGR